MKAKDFNLPDQNGKNISLSDYVGSWVVLYFYPKDDTPGCTKEACSFRDSISKFEKEKTVILGVSKDSVESHKKFTEKYHLNFPILSDTEKKVIKEYDAWGGIGTKRITYLINPQGEIQKVYSKVNPLIHADQVLKDINTNNH